MAEDDIIELTDIVKEGHASAQQVAEPPAEPSLPADFMAETLAPTPEVPSAAPQVPDFGADLDALLQNYDEAETVQAAPPSAVPVSSGSVDGAATASVESGQAGAAVAAPIANQDDSGRAVDPNEELDLPPLSDLDALLEELGVQDSGPAASSAPADFSIGDDLDAMPAPGLDLAAEAAEPPAAAAPEVDLAAVAAGVAAARVEKEPAETPVSPEAPAPSRTEEAGDADDGIDLNELDALLDSVLSVAPKPKPAQEAATLIPELPLSEPAPATMPDNAGDVNVEALQKEIMALRAELADLKDNIDKYAAAAAAKVIREEIAALAAHLD